MSRRTLSAYSVTRSLSSRWEKASVDQAIVSAVRTARRITPFPEIRRSTGARRKRESTARLCISPVYSDLCSRVLSSTTSRGRVFPAGHGDYTLFRRCEIIDKIIRRLQSRGKTQEIVRDTEISFYVGP